MKLNIPYPGLKKTIGYLVLQARESVPQVDEFIPSYIREPDHLFHELKTLTTYKSDPRGVEYIPTVRTLLGKNKGYGDCDCFTVLSLASLYRCCGIRANIVLVGYNTFLAKHIYTNFTKKGKRITFDLTNPYYDFERAAGPSGKKYRYFQDVKVNL